MALLFACHQLDLPIHVLHVNHRLQAMSDDWQKLVETFCQTHDIPCQSFTLSWQTPEHVNEQHARNARYQAMADAVSNHAVIATAHHAGDQAETLLINLCKGTGLTGLIGMAEISEQHEFGKPLILWRPLLNISREKISEFVTTYSIPYVDDPTNVMGDNQRAFLREQIFPLLNRRFHNVIDNINRTQTNLQNAKTIVNEQVTADWQTCHIVTPNPFEQQLSIAELKNLSTARRFELLHVWVKGEQKFAPNRQLIEQIEMLIVSDNPEQQTILHWQGVQIRRYRGTLYRLLADYFHRLAAELPEILPYRWRVINPNEALQRLSNAHHEPFKKLCQRLAIPSWERAFGKLLCQQRVSQESGVTSEPVALVLPFRTIWLAGSGQLNDIERQTISQQLEDFWQACLSK